MEDDEDEWDYLSMLFFFIQCDPKVPSLVTFSQPTVSHKIAGRIKWVCINREKYIGCLEIHGIKLEHQC